MSNPNWWALAVFGCGILTCGMALAAGEPPSVVDDDVTDTSNVSKTEDVPCPPPTRRHPYGWQTLATDFGGFGLIAVGGAMHFDTAGAPALAAGVGMLFLGGPLVHVAHGRWPTAVLDLGLRLTLPLVGGWVASGYCPGECGGKVAAGLMVGLSPIWIDAGLLAWEDVPVDTARSDRSVRVPRTLAKLGVTELHPTTLPTRRGLVLGMGGSF